MPDDAQALREFLLGPGGPGTDWDLSDEALSQAARDAKERIRGRRWSWKVLARESLVRAHDAPTAEPTEDSDA